MRLFRNDRPLPEMTPKSIHTRASVSMDELGVVLRPFAPKRTAPDEFEIRVPGPTLAVISWDESPAVEDLTDDKYREVQRKRDELFRALIGLGAVQVAADLHELRSADSLLAMVPWEPEENDLQQVDEGMEARITGLLGVSAVQRVTHWRWA